MPRRNREYSESGIYHIILKGIDDRVVFIDDSDKMKFLFIIKDVIKKNYCEVYAYCLMENHVHLLLKSNEKIGTCMKRITVSYVHYHNSKYERSGHLFRNRYVSEPVDSERYFLTVARYIHQNPLKAFMVKDIKLYKWSSYNSYIEQKDKYISIESNLLSNYFPIQEEFVAFMTTVNEDTCLEYKNSIRLTDEKLINYISKSYQIEKIKIMKKTTRDRIIGEIICEVDVSIRQLSRVTGISRGVLQRIYKNKTHKNNVPLNMKS